MLNKSIKLKVFLVHLCLMMYFFNNSQSISVNANTDSKYFESMSIFVKTNFSTVTSGSTIKQTVTHSKIYTKIPKIAYGIKNYRGSDQINQQTIFFYASSLNLTNTVFTIQYFGNSDLRIFNIHLLLIDFNIPYHFNTFHNELIKNDKLDGKGAKTCRTLVNYTALCLKYNYSKNVLSSNFSNNKILFFINRLKMTIDTKALNKPQYSLTTIIANVTAFNIDLNTSDNLAITQIQASIIVIDISTFVVGSQPIASIITINGATASNYAIMNNLVGTLIIGLQQFSVSNPLCGLQFNWEYDKLNNQVIFNASLITNTTSTTANCGLLTSTVSLFYLKIDYCSNTTTPYYNPNDLKCYDMCPAQFYQDNITKQCLKCQTGCSQCKNGPQNGCTFCFPDYGLNNSKCVLCSTFIPNCKTTGVAQNGQCYCKQCNSTNTQSYDLTASMTQCVKSTVNECKYYNDNNTSLCAECKADYQLVTVNGTTKCRKIILNCLTYSTDDLCSVCKTNYTLQDSKTTCWLSTISNCSTYDNSNNSICKSCVSGYQLINNNTACRKIITHCVTYSSDGLCSQCQTNYTLESSKSNCWIQVVANCLYYQNGGNSICMTCKDGFEKINSTKCRKIISNCVTYSSNDLCSACQSSETITYQLNTAKDMCVASKVQNCLTLNSTNSSYCIKCYSAYQLINNGTKCRLIIPHCTKYNVTTDLCLQCEIVNSTTYYKPTTEGYACELNKNNTNGTTSILHCQTYDTTNSSKCSSCQSPYKLNTDNTLCIIQCDVTNCQTCSSTNNCSTCLSSYKIYLNQSTKLNQCFQCNINKCAICNKDNVCQTCIGGTILFNGTCAQCKSPCSTCTSDLKCMTCVKPYFSTPDSNGNCFYSTVSQCIKYDSTNTTKCQQCAVNYVLDSTQNLCQFPCNYPCLTCISTKCQTCDTGHYLSSKGQCLTCPYGCDQCTSGSTCVKASKKFYLINSQSKICPSFCADCTSQTNCLALDSEFQNKGYILVNKNGTIVLGSCDLGCLSCSNTNIHLCTKCDAGYTMNNGVCQMCDSICKTCSSTNSSKCLTCFQNTFKQGDTCITCNPNCLTCDSGSNPDICLSCKQGSYLSGKTCISGCPSNCLSCSSPNVCTECMSGYTLYLSGSNTICVQCTKYCRYCVYNQPAICLECGDGSYMVSNQCSPCPTNCKTCTSKGCSKCHGGYKLNSDLTCTTNCNSPCATCEGKQSNKCTSCILGYSYDAINNKCIPLITCENGCDSCPQGYTLNSTSNCVKCKTSNCRSCDSTTQNICNSCISGYYLNSQTLKCQTCSKQCKTCVISQSSCTECSPGYTSISSIISSTFSCLPCSGNCATCIDQTTKCTSCVAQYQLSGWQCIKSQRYLFNVVLDTDLNTFNKKYLNFMNQLATGTTVNTTNMDILAFDKIKQGSVIVNGSVDSSSTQAYQQELSNLKQILTENQYIGSMKILSSSVISVNPTPTPVNPKTPTQQGPNLGLILGLTIPLVLIMAIVAFVVIRKLRQKEKDMAVDKQNNGQTNNKLVDSRNSLDFRSNQTL